MDLQSDILKRILAVPFGWNLTSHNLLENLDANEDELEINNKLTIVDKGLNARMGYRLFAEEVNKQKNIEDIVRRTDALLNKDNDCRESKEDVNPDWIFNFMEKAGKTYDDKLKDYWAKLLADEIRRPGTYSLRTLEVLRNISHEEAKLFERISGLVFVQDQISFIFHDGNKYGLNYYNLSKLRETGLLQSNENAAFTIAAPKGSSSRITLRFVCGNKYIELNTFPDSKDVFVPVCMLTQAGCELYELTEHRDNPEYQKDFAAFVRKTNPTVSILYGDILERIGHKVKYKLPLIEL